MSKRATVSPLRFTSMARRLPTSESPPEANSAWETRDRAERERAPGTRTSPASMTLMERRRPIETKARMPMRAEATLARISSAAASKLMPPTCTRPISGRAMAPARSMVRANSPPNLPEHEHIQLIPGTQAVILRNGSIIHWRKGADLRGKESEAKALRRIQRLNDQRRSGFLLGVLFFRLKVTSKGIKGIDQLPIGPKEGRWAG